MIIEHLFCLESLAPALEFTTSKINDAFGDGILYQVLGFWNANATKSYKRKRIKSCIELRTCSERAMFTKLHVKSTIRAQPMNKFWITKDTGKSGLFYSPILNLKKSPQVRFGVYILHYFQRRFKNKLIKRQDWTPLFWIRSMLHAHSKCSLLKLITILNKI